MGEIVNVLVAFAVIVFIFRWATSGNGPHDNSRQRSPAELLGFRPKNVTQDMISTIANMFPDIPADNIRYDLLRSGSVEVTTNKILERGYLEAPPAAYYTLYPRTNRAPQPHATPNDRRTAAHVERQAERRESLITRFKLEERIKNEKEREEIVQQEDVGGKAVWEDTAEKREASLRERKEKMILAARERLLAQQAEKSPLASGSSSGVQS